MTEDTDEKTSAGPSFGFAAIMAGADRRRFARWRAVRWRLPNNPFERGASEQPPVAAPSRQPLSGRRFDAAA